MRSGERRYAALFDLDGVIIDGRVATVDALRTLAQTWSLSMVDETVLGRCAAVPPMQALEMLGVPDPREVYYGHFDAALSAAASEGVLVFEPVIAAMSALAGHGAGVGIVTAQARSRIKFWIPPAVADLTDFVVAYEDAVPKPAPDGVLAACARLGVLPSRAFFLGDSPTDITAGRAAGVFTVGAGWGFAGPDALRDAGADLVLTSPDEVGPELLSHLGAD
ncbi:HAD family hydrolase [Nocardia fusca]|uniref:HAD family hydrolase n=1 Tax=Nocardia fusca TaxID=941183 RepID=UPI0007C64CFD|nr:HAD family hydrolase [Nocardia fusca]